MVNSSKNREPIYRPVKAVPVTGLFPGFAKPLFLAEYANAETPNTLYAQYVLEEQIISFEPVGSDLFTTISLPQSDKIANPGGVPLYVYAFSAIDTAIGTRGEIASVIEERFDEIAAKELAACTAAQFARLKSRLPQANRNAYNLLLRLNATSAYVWRDTAVFLQALKDEFLPLGVPSAAISLKSAEKNDKLQVALSLGMRDLSVLRRKSLEKTGKRLLLASGLFGRNDLFTIQLSAGEGPTYRANTRLFGADELGDALQGAKRFLEQKVFQPVLATRRASKRSVNLVRHAKQWVSKFEKIGDLVRYMDRFKPDSRQPLLPLSVIKQIQFEDIHAEFMRKFARYRGFQTTPEDFEEGNRYSAFLLSIYTQTYNNQSGGIRPVGKIGSHKAVVVSITFSGGNYANEWLEPEKRLKCYLRSSRIDPSKPDEAQNANRSIMKYPNVPVLVFTRQSGERDFLFSGTFRYERVTADERGRKWFELTKLESEVADA